MLVAYSGPSLEEERFASGTRRVGKGAYGIGGFILIGN